MVDPWWSLLGAAIPAVIMGQALRMKKRRAEEQRLKSARGREKSSDDIFVCERVCTSKRMLKKVGSLSKEPTIDTCVTVCGVSQIDACADACARTVCVNQHQVPNWNDICLRKCQRQCKNCIGYDSMRSTTYASADGLREDGIKFKLRLCLNPEGNGVYG
ncbi:hypothetical protein KPL70_015793 [Citrus sinensis]|nr:hypothetical protein KPL70_015793 [Citrus sinensis]